MCVISVVCGPVYLLFQSYRDAAECRAIAMSIALAMRSYASNWDGMPHPHHDCDYYIKQFGYRLSSETGYYSEEPPWYDP
ncbi:MAG: hypothetical protein QF886_09805, partial [Planctomycetota bacterium]|nr:hypothetical protein [Planctomycetota bacterium]